MRPLVIVGASGCLLPLAILFNTFFGLFFLRPLHWLLTESVLFLIFFLSAALTARRMMNPAGRGRKGVIDVQGTVVDGKDDKKSLTNH
jgi:hypothetical protein